MRSPGSDIGDEHAVHYTVEAVVDPDCQWLPADDPCPFPEQFIDVRTQCMKAPLFLHGLVSPGEDASRIAVAVTGLVF